MGEKYKWKTKYCWTCEEWVENKKAHYLEFHPEKIWKKVKGFNIKYEDEIHELVTIGTLECLFKQPEYPNYMFRVPDGEDDVRLEDGKKVKAESIYTFKYPEIEEEEEE